MALEGFTIGGSQPSGSAPAAPFTSSSALKGFTIGATAKPFATTTAPTPKIASTSIPSVKPADTSSMFSKFLNFAGNAVKSASNAISRATTAPTLDQLPAGGKNANLNTLAYLPSELARQIPGVAQLQDDSKNISTKAASPGFLPVLNASNNKLNAEKTALDTAQKQVNVTDQKSVDAFNAKVDQYNADLGHYQKQVDLYNKMVGQDQANESTATGYLGEASYLTPKDVLGTVPGVVGEAAKGFASMSIKGVTDVWDLGRMFLGKNPNTSITLPVLGKINSQFFDAADRVRNGEDPLQATVESVSGSIFDVLFLADLMGRVAGPRQVKTAEVHGNFNDIKPGSVSMDTGPKTGRLYEPPTAYNKGGAQVIPPDALAQMKSQGVPFGPKFDPAMPTFFRVIQGEGGNYTGEVMQLKPSYLKTAYESMFGTKQGPKTVPALFGAPPPASPTELSTIASKATPTDVTTLHSATVSGSEVVGAIRSTIQNAPAPEASKPEAPAPQPPSVTHTVTHNVLRLGGADTEQAAKGAAILKGDIQDHLATHGAITTHTALMERLGVDARTADSLIREAQMGERTPESVLADLAKSQPKALQNFKIAESVEGALTKYDTPEIVKARAEQAAIPRTDVINTPEREALRTKIVDEAYGDGAAVKGKRLDIVSGVPASGKSTNLAEPLAREHGALLTDSDEIKKKLPEYKEGIGAMATHHESARLNFNVMQRGFANGDNMVFPTVGVNENSLNRLIDLAHEKGYEIHIHHADLHPDKAAERVISRFKETGRFVDPDYLVNHVGLKSKENYDKVKSNGKVNTYTRYNADVPKGGRYMVVERGIGGNARTENVHPRVGRGVLRGEAKRGEIDDKVSGERGTTLSGSDEIGAPSGSDQADIRSGERTGDEGVLGKKEITAPRGFVSLDPIVKTQEYIEQTNKNIAAAKSLDDTLYKTQRNIEADRLESDKLFAETKSIPQSERRNIDVYRDALEAGLTLPTLTPYEKQINDKIIDPLLKDATEKRTFIKDNGIVLDSTVYNPRLVKEKGGVIDSLVKAKNNILDRKAGGRKSILSKSSPALKTRIHKALTDKNGKRTIVAIKHGQVTAFRSKEPIVLGNLKMRKNADLLAKEVEPVQNKIKRLQKIVNILKSVRTREPVSAKKLEGLKNRITELKEVIKENTDTAHIKIYESITRDINKLSARIDALGKKYKTLKPFEKKSEAVAKEITSIEKDLGAAYEKESNLAYSDVYEQVSDIASKSEQLTDKAKNTLRTIAKEFQILSKVKSAGQVVLTQKRISTLEKKILDAVNEMGEIEFGYDPDTLNQKKFIDNAKNEYTIGEATKAEIEQHTKTQYYHDPITAAILTHENISQVYRAVQVLDAYKNAPEFKEIAFERGTGTPPDGWKPSPLDQFRNYYFEPHTWKVLNAYKNDLDSNDPMRALTIVNNLLLHTMFLSPIKHGLNVGVMATVNRGASRWLNPFAYPTLAQTTIRAVRDVVTQNDDFTKVLREGASFMSARSDGAERRANILANIGEPVSQPTKVLHTTKKVVGAVTPFNWVHALVWPATDIFMQQGILENLTLQGVALKDATPEQINKAITETGNIIPNYRPSVTIRQAPNWTRRNFLLFMSWRESLYRNVLGLAKTAVTGDAGFKDSMGGDAWKARAKAADKIAVIGFLALIVWPYLNDEWKKITKNANASVFSPSVLGILDNVNKLATGQIDIGQYIQTMVSLPPATQEAMQQVLNVDFYSGQHIRDTTTTVAEQFNQSVQHAEKAATLFDQYNKIDTGAISPTQFIESQAGLNNPDAVQTKLVAAIQTAQTRLDKLDPATVANVINIYNQAKKAGFGTSEADALVNPLNASDYKIYQDLKAVDQARENVALSDKIEPIVVQAYQAGFGTPAANALVANLSDSEIKAYQAIKTILYGAKGTSQPNFTPGTTTDDKSIIGSVLAYASAIRTDPLTAFERIFTGQRILRTENGAIIVERNTQLESNMRKQLGATTEMTLDHIKSFELGGDNSTSNMWLIPKAQAATDDKVENLLGAALSAGKISGEQAREYELRYKKGADVAEINARTQKLFDSVGDPLTAEQVQQLVQ